eukprot:CAMPEP_0175804570 /NCGR_PEP_ID=MMETSP0107_2-20121207/189_1 /TAXON_ID=195067 ORGANISM="Goniomonas pacifica, Strain CCMP1869" /NCGR_SAMPLE_ID=MMETSP0107_2 /ASSEMBLY_ACC=CAM_ASM_000203 /LENGTH=367 /DNA_ID=CAMNT_0017115925 /DNA_START=8 /DNA_END=1111 /DNA_ORIENTATION=+
MAEAAKGIPDVVRAEVWTAVLGVGLVPTRQPVSLGAELEAATLKQIATDTPRCHPYNLSLASDFGQRRLQRVLMHWTRCNPDLSYSQGLDSLAAPFVLLHLDNPEKASTCLQVFVDKFLHNLLRPDHTKVLHRTLTCLSRLLAFQDPVLAVHLYDINVGPNLYAVPWFLTWFCHMLPLDQVMTLWDRTLLSSKSLTVYIAAAVVRSVRDLLLTFDFDQFVTFFSQGPSFDVVMASVSAAATMETSPPSLVVVDGDTEDDNLNPLTPVISLEDAKHFGVRTVVLDARPVDPDPTAPSMATLSHAFPCPLSSLPDALPAAVQGAQLIIVAAEDPADAEAVVLALLRLKHRHVAVLQVPISVWIQEDTTT